MDKQEDIIEFQTQFNGPFPFTTDGVVVGAAERRLRGGDADEDHLRRTAPRSTPSLGTFNHENMHQWFGDNVAEGAVQPDVLEGGLGDGRRVPQHRAHRGDRRGRHRHAGR